MSVIVDIPLSNGAPLPFFDIQAALDGALYTLQFRWNVRASAWYMDIFDQQGLTLLVAGLRLVASWPLAAYLSTRQPRGAFVIVDSTGTESEPGLTQLGVTHKLIYYTAAELRVS